MRKLPHSPADVLDIVNPDLKKMILTALENDKKLLFNKLPRKDAATLLEEMTPEDMIDWALKSVRPIITMEDGAQPQKELMLNKKIIALPKGFDKKSSLSFNALGDLLYADGLEASKDKLFEKISYIFEADVTYANFESPVTQQKLVKEVISDAAAPIECCDEEKFYILTHHKHRHFDVLNAANNHIYDMGIEGIETTLDTFSKSGIMDVGTNRTREDANHCRTLTKNDIKLGFVSYTFGLNGHQLPEDEQYRVNVADLVSKFSAPQLENIKQQIDDCKAQECDFIIASMHWGYEFEMFPRLRQIKAARELVEYGADAIICHHPHVIQPVEYYRTQRDPDRVATIAYSLGSLTWGFTAPHLALSLIQNLELVKGRVGDKAATYIGKSDITPVFRSVASDNDNIVTRIERLKGYPESTEFHTREYISQMKKYADLVLG